MKKLWIGCMIVFVVILGTSNREEISAMCRKVSEKALEGIWYQMLVECFETGKLFDSEETFIINTDSGISKSLLLYEQQKKVLGGGEEETMKLASLENQEKREEAEEFVVNTAGEVEKIKQDTKKKTAKSEESTKTNSLVEQLRQNLDTDFLIDNFYIVDSTTSVRKSLFSVKKMLAKDFSIEKTQEPQILIFHTHGGSEYFADGTKEEDSVVAVGEYLAELLEEEYGYKVIHDETKYDYVNGSLDRNKAYNQALDGISKQLEEHPSIQVVIDLHRDGGNTKERKVTEIDGKQVAQFMIFNGLSRNQNGEITYLKNPNLQANLAFGLQIKLSAMEKYPNLTIRNYLKGYRYNMHLRERYLLLELGNQNNTVEEARNTMPYLAEILDDVLSKE